MGIGACAELAGRGGPSAVHERVQVPSILFDGGNFLPRPSTRIGLTWYQIKAEGTQQEEVEAVIVVLEHGFRCLVWVSRDQTLAGSKSGSPGPKTKCVVFHVELAALAMGRLEN